MKQYKTVNNLVGWLTFIIAATVYCMTIEPTASFWDCPEFITTGYKLEVGHPPGAPFFMLTANLFSQFASDATTVAKMVNYMSALMSGACILFLFWSITHLVRKLIIKDENNITTGQLITIMGSGLVGALVYTFSDTFWFSAVEGEVYAYSSLFTAVVFWLILKWEDVADQPHSDRWIILIAYLTGLSIGVHLLNLLCLPAIVLVYYYKKVPNANAKGSLLALFGSMVLVAEEELNVFPLGRNVDHDGIAAFVVGDVDTVDIYPSFVLCCVCAAVHTREEHVLCIFIFHTSGNLDVRVFFVCGCFFFTDIFGGTVGFYRNAISVFDFQFYF